jgi:Tfp pilus assembly protein PilF
VEPGTEFSVTREEWERTVIISAISTLTEIIEKNPDNADAYQMRAEWYEKLGRPEVAASDRRQAVKLDPKVAH